jgi:hypothetical protein
VQDRPRQPLLNQKMPGNSLGVYGGFSSHTGAEIDLL